MSEGRRRFSVETLVLLAVGTAFFGAGAFICVSAYNAGQAPAALSPVVVARLTPPEPPPALPPPMMTSAEPEPTLPEPYVYAPAGPPKSIFTQPLPQDYTPPPAPRAQVPVQRTAPARQNPVFAERPTSPSVALGPSAPMPHARPIDLNQAAPAVVALAPAPTPPPGPERKTDGVEFGPKPATLNQYDRFTAVYDLMAHTVYLPDGSRLEAHSGLGPLRDDPAHVEERDRGATPPHVYDLTMREDLFHGVQALRLNPVGGPSAIFGRAGLLAHTYMLGEGGDSNGCVSFKNYDAFLAAFRSGQVKKLVVVTSLSVASR
jgi:hypothetical protein